MEKQTGRRAMISSLILARGKILFQIVFSVWVTLGERKWITLA
jgi:hypothetical protein